ncbi:MAG: terpene cyclase/mutase family protein [Planctomycetes bacterium]|nr:terpene cyclase/mutase family protein [Planctomycetota bacterium]
MQLHLGVLAVLALALSTTPLGAQTSKPKSAAPEPQHPKDLKPVPAAEIPAAIQRGRQILLALQESLDDKPVKSEWPYEGVYRVEREIPLGYRIGGTAICATALLETTSGELDAETQAAVERALAFVLESLPDPLMSTDFEKGYDVRGWGHAYALSFLLEARGVPAFKGQKDKLDDQIRKLIGILEKTQIKKDGGWNYSRPKGDDSSASPFMTAPTLQFLFEAQTQGFKVDGTVIEAGLKTLEDARLESGAFQYSTNPERKNGKGFEDIPGSTGRSPVCETTLFLAGRGSVERIQKSLDDFLEHWRWLEQRRRQNGTHVPPYMIAPYYFFYAHRYAAQAIEFLPEDKRAGYRTKLYELLWHVREESGGWNDRVFPRSENFGTAMTMMALHEPQAARPSGWKSPNVKKAK